MLRPRWRKAGKNLIFASESVEKSATLLVGRPQQFLAHQDEVSDAMFVNW
jgi:hypothetical protein